MARHFLMASLVLTLSTWGDTRARSSDGDIQGSRPVEGVEINEWKYLAERDFAQAQYWLGISYVTGKDIPKDPAQAARWFKRAFLGGYAPAGFALALLYTTDSGVPNDNRIASRLFYRAGMQGVAAAQLRLAEAYSEGNGVPKDIRTALEWATIAEANAAESVSKNSAANLQDVLRPQLSAQDVVSALDNARRWQPRREILRFPIAGFRESNNFSTSLYLTDNEAIVRWRLTQASERSSPAINGSVGRNPLTSIDSKSYIETEQHTSIMLLLDAGGAGRETIVESGKGVLGRMLQQAKAPRYDIDLAVAADGLQMIEPQTEGDNAFIDAANGMAPQPAVASRLNDSILTAIDMPPLNQAARRGVFVMTDGRAEEPLNANAIIEAAESQRTSLTFIVSSPLPAEAVSTMTAIAAATGGQVIGPHDLETFLKKPFALLESGGTVRLALTRPVRLPWEDDPDLVVTVRSEGKDITLTAPLTVPVAGPLETAHIVAQRYRYEIAGVGLAAVAAIGGLGYVSRRRRQPGTKMATDDLPKPTAANNGERSRFTLSNLDDGTEYAISILPATIGRGTDADVRLNEETVSRHHAVMNTNADGRVEIVNQSANGTMVNHRRIDSQTLADGDLITMGSMTLRFSASA